MSTNSRKYKMLLTKLIYEKKGTAPNSDSMSQAIKVLEMKALFSDEETKLSKRIAKKDKSYYYDLCNKDWSVIKLDENGSSIDENSPILFTRGSNMKEQQPPDLTVEPRELVGLVDKHFSI